MPMRRMPLLVSLSLILAGCGSADVGTASPSPVTPAGSELSGSPLPSETGVADDPSGTLTIFPNTQADGPGQSVRSSIARAPVQMALVNGWLLIDADGTMWLCEALITSDPPRCDGARLRVEGYTAEELDHIRQLGDIRESGGIHWLPQRTQRFGNVTTP